MTKKLFVIVAAVFVFLPQPFFVHAAEPSPAKPCEQQQLKVQSLEREREITTLVIQELRYKVRHLQETFENDNSRAGYEILQLRDENRRLNETLERIRSQIGNGKLRPY